MSQDEGGWQILTERWSAFPGRGLARRRPPEEALVPGRRLLVLGLEFAPALPELVGQLPQASVDLFFRSTLVHS